MRRRPAPRSNSNSVGATLVMKPAWAHTVRVSRFMAMAPQVAVPCGFSGVAMLVHTLLGQPSWLPIRTHTSSRSAIGRAASDAVSHA